MPRALWHQSLYFAKSSIAFRFNVKKVLDGVRTHVVCWIRAKIKGLSMSAAAANIHLYQRPKRSVAIRRDGDDFVVSFMPDDHVIYRHESAFALRRLCEQLRWAVVYDAAVE
jgi:hypothetical protein